MDITVKIELTGSKILGLLIVILGAILSYLLKDGTIFIASATAGAGLYANKQFQDRMTTKYKEQEHDKQ